jgi:hypothetical protein
VPCCFSQRVVQNHIDYPLLLGITLIECNLRNDYLDFSGQVYLSDSYRGALRYSANKTEDGGLQMIL